MKALKIPKSKKVPGLFTYCTECQKRIGKEICGDSGKSIDSCKSKDKHIFKLSVSVPNTSTVKTKNLDTRNLREATKEAFRFREELEESNFEIPQNESDIPEDFKYILLVDTMKMYIDYLNNIDVPDHLQKDRTKRYINDVARTFRKFTRALKNSKFNLELFRVDQISDSIVGSFHNYLLEVEKYGNKTYNKHIATMRQFIAWLNEKKGYAIANPFKGVRALPTIERNETITQKEFSKLLEVITPENSKDKRVKYRKYYYKPWLIGAFKLALYTGLRREEFLTLKWSSIEYNEEGVPILIKVPNFKVIRLQNGKRTEDIRTKWVPIIPELHKLLKNELEMSKHQNTQRFLIAHDDERNREGLILFISKAFGHFWNVTGITRKVQLNDLRNTYITELFKAFGDSAAVITDHSDIKTVKKHYMKAKLVSEAATGFEVFKNS